MHFSGDAFLGTRLFLVLDCYKTMQETNELFVVFLRQYFEPYLYILFFKKPYKAEDLNVSKYVKSS